MARVTLTPAEIVAGMNEDGFRLGSGQYSFSIPILSSIWPTYAAGTEPFATGFGVLSTAQAANFRLALAQWDELIAPNFTEVADTATSRGEIRVGFTSYNMGQGTAAYAYQSVPQPAGGKVGDVWVNGDSTAQTFDRGTYWFETLVHEIGHAIGLKHPFDAPAIPTPFENRRYTVMSYTEPFASEVVSFSVSGGSIRASWRNVTAVTPMVIDIAAVQSIYGADTTTRSGDTVYRFNQDDRSLQSIYDAGGNDTIDLSNITRPNTIDLTPGGYSSVGEWGLEAQIAYWTAQFPGGASFIRNTLSARDLYTNSDNLGIALSTVIENATGGSGADRITGNAVANILRGMAGSDTISGGDGDDRLEGGAGDDVLTGGAGADVFVFGGSDGADRITDFSVTEDRFDLGGRSFLGTTETAAGVVLTHSGGTVRLDGVNLTLAEANARVIGAAIDPTPAPINQLLAAWPADAATGVAVTAPLRLVFAGQIARGAGAVALTKADGTLVESFAADSARLTLAGNVLTVDPTRPLEAGSGYLLTIAPGAITVGGTAFAGLSDYNFTTAAASSSVPVSAYNLILPKGAAATATGSGDVFGTAGAQRVIVADLTGQVTLDPSFNAGGDTLVLAGAAAGWSVVRSGSSVRFSDGDTSVVLPVGIVGADVQFGDGVRAVRFSQGAGTILLGDQVVTTTAAPIVAMPGAATAAGAIDTSLPSLLVVAPGATATAAGTLQVFGTAGAETVYARGSRVEFDPSFNTGGDVLVLSGRAGDYTAVRSGSTVVLTSSAQTVSLPVGIAGTTVRFADGDRALGFERSPAGTVIGVKLGDQSVGTTAAGVAPVATTTATLDRDDDASLLTPFTIDAGTGNLRFTDDAAVAQNVRLTGFGRGDSLVLSGSASDYLFASSGQDLVIQRVGTGGVLSTTTLVGLADPGVIVTSEATAELAAGFDFVTFAI